MSQHSMTQMLNNPDIQILRRVPTSFTPLASSDARIFTLSIIDLETMGLDPLTHELIEIGILTCSFSSSEGILSVLDTYNELQDPGKPIPAEVTRVTGITNEDVCGKAINWSRVHALIKKSDLIICHNSGFDRNFLELQTPSEIALSVKAAVFGCTLKDINWKERGIESSKLDYINWKLGYFYDAHRAINDCWATLNVLLQAEGAFDELKNTVKKKDTFICATNAPFEKKDILKARRYRWSDGLEKIPKGWWTIVSNEQLVEEKNWLNEVIYCKEGASERLPQWTITARTRYSFRAECPN